jgi:hypothetical protein
MKKILVLSVIVLFIGVGVCPSIAGFNENISQINLNEINDNIVEDISFDIIYINDIYTEQCDGCGSMPDCGFCLIANTGTTTITENDLKNIEINISSDIEGAFLSVGVNKHGLIDKQIGPGQVAGTVRDDQNHFLTDFLKYGETLINWYPRQTIYFRVTRYDYIGYATFNISFTIRGKTEYLQTNVDFQDGYHKVKLISGKRTNCDVPPTAPNITGPSNGKPGTSYIYSFNSTDPERDDVYYFIDWGDNTQEDWFGPFPSGVEVTKSHIFENPGAYTIYVKAKDINGNEGNWSCLWVTMPRYKVVSNTFLIRLVERFPLLQQLIDVCWWNLV